MKFLADVNVEKRIVDLFRDFGIDIKWVTDYNRSMTDAELLEMAEHEKRILITNDKDFGELIFLKKQNSSGVILMRVKEQNSEKKIILFSLKTISMRPCCTLQSASAVKKFMSESQQTGVITRGI